MISGTIRLLRRLEHSTLSQENLLQYYKVLNRAYIQYIKKHNTKKLQRQTGNKTIERLITQVESLFAPWLLLIFSSLTQDTPGMRVQQHLSSVDTPPKQPLVSENGRNRFLIQINKFFEYYIQINYQMILYKYSVGSSLEK